MKKILTLFLLAPVLLLAQQTDTKTLFELKNDIKQSPVETDYQTGGIQVFQQEKKSAGLAIIYSMLLPGMGELYAGSYSSGKYFTIAEGIMWGTLVGMNIYGGWQEDRYKSYAQSHAGVSSNGKDEDYYATIGEYLNIEDYNHDQTLYRDFNETYNSDEYSWKWQTQEERRTYRSMWTSSEEAYNNIRFVVGAMILNRIASAINAVRLVAAHNRNLNEEVGWNLSVGVSQQSTLPSSLTLNFTKSF